MRALGEIPLELLHLDTENPRLPETLDSRNEIDVLAHLYRTAALEELAESIRANGFFTSEPLIVSAADVDGSRTVLEGNRRLATVLVLMQDARALEAGVQFHFADGGVGAKITALPTVEVEDLDEFNAYLGFRHISGLRVWGAGEKARYLWTFVNELEKTEGDNTFYKLGRTVGSNARGIRSAFIAYELLQHAKREGGDAQLVSYVLSERFGVWVRLLGTKNVGARIGLAESAFTLSDVRRSIEQTNVEALMEVLADLRPTAGRKNALIADSRQVTAYSDVVGNEIARSVLRQSGNLELATAVVEKPDIDQQLQAVIDQLRLVTELVSDDGALTEVSTSLAERVVKSARVMFAAVSAFGIAEGME